MTRGDKILMGLIVGTLVGLGIDGVSNGALGSWIGSNIPTIASSVGSFLSAISIVFYPLIVFPLVAAIAGRFGFIPSWLENSLNHLIKFIDQISITTADAVRWSALILVVITATVVIQRYVFGISMTKLQESVIYLHSILFLLSSAATLLRGGHVRVDIIYSKLDDRAKARTDLIGVYLALIPMCWMILDASQSYVGSAWRILERSRESDGLPLVFLLKTAIPVFAIMMILQGLSMAARSALTLSGREAPQTGAEHSEAEI